jgi:predicted permease
MPWRLPATLRALFGRREWERDMDEELRGHMDLRADHWERGGLSRAEAERRARMEFGSAEHYREEVRSSFGLRWFDEFRQDLRYASRTLRRSPGFTLVAVLSLALGIGANTAVFSILNSMILRPLPVEAPERLVFLMGGRGATSSFPNYLDLRDRNSTLSGLAAYRVSPVGIDTDAGPRRLWGYLVTGNYFDLLGVRPLLGRFFHAEEDTRPGQAPLAVLSYGAWQSRFAADLAIVGKTVRINKLPYTVVGVAPREFFGTELIFSPDLWVPMMMQPQIEGHSWLENRSTFNCMVIGRMKPGVTLGQAQGNVNALAASLAREFPEDDAGMVVHLTKPGLVGDSVRGAMETFLAGVMLLAGLVLLAACVNLGSLLAARASDRHFELAIRLSIGAGRARILRQLLTEALAVAMLGGAVGCALAAGLLQVLNRTAPPVGVPLRFDFSPDGRVLLFAVAATLVTGLIFGLAPARHAVNADPNPVLRGMSSGRRHGRRWPTRDLLLAGQVALCCFLVTASFVSVRGLSRALDMPVGFQPKGLNVAAFDLGLAGYSRDEGRRFQRRAAEAAAHIPGVTAAAYGNSVPLWINQNSASVYPGEAMDLRPTNAIWASHYNISPGYLAVVGIRLLAGRDFSWHDDANAPKVAIVNETFAREVLKTSNPVGRRIRAGGEMMEVAGMVEDGKYTSLNESPHPAFFRSALQNYDDATIVLVRSRLTDSEVSQQLRRMTSSLDAQLPLYALGSVDQLLGIAYLPARAATMLLSAFGLLAVMLAITGIYGLASYTVSRRVREIGIRVAVGARWWQVLGGVLGRMAVLLSAGSVAGLAMGLAATRLLASIVYQASPRDPVVLAAVAATMAAVALLSAWIPARRAISVDPIRSLRHE